MKTEEEGERRSDKMEVHKNFVNSKRKKEKRWTEIILSKSPFISLSVAERFSFVRWATFWLHGVPLSLYSLPLEFSSYSPSLPFVPALLPKAEWQPFIPHQTHFMTAADLHSCWIGCPKDFLTRPWIRLLASHSLFLSAWLDSDVDIKWTLIKRPSRPTQTMSYVFSCVASEAAETPQTRDYAFYNTNTMWAQRCAALT